MQALLNNSGLYHIAGVHDLWINIPGVILISFIITYVLIPPIIRISKKHNFVDIPGQRKAHKVPVPTLGGAGIFMGFFIASLPWTIPGINAQILFITASLLILFFLGIIDDLKELSASRKLLFQIITAFLIAFSGIRIESLSGFLGIYEIPVVAQYILTIILIAGVTNAFNLIDGIDGLAGGIALINAVFMGVILTLSGYYIFGMIAFALAGSLIAFLRYNFYPAKIFMGDTGSLVIGFTMSLLGIFIIQHATAISSAINISGNIMIVISGILLIPVYDTIRVAIVRIQHKKSPFRPDKNHIHHLLTETGYNHKKAAIILYVSNLSIIAAGFLLKDLNPNFSIPVLFVMAVLLTEMLNIRRIILNKIKARFLGNKADDIVSENRFLQKNLK
ncbi:MAG: MraY family glycosyltransferase [Bacteroidales bacterium]